MKGFLEEVAADLYARCGEELSECEVLFPSRRARLFFTEALSRIARRPMWQPAWVTVDDLMTEISGLETGDRVRLVTELYKVYSRYHDEPFDRFYFWGDMLLADFDTIDKYLIDARELFRNISDIKEIEADISYLTPQQLQILRFWSTLGPEADLSEEKRRFLAIWKTLYPIYGEFRARLAELGIAYNGMVQRAAAVRHSCSSASNVVRSLCSDRSHSATVSGSSVSPGMRISRNGPSTPAARQRATCSKRLVPICDFATLTILAHPRKCRSAPRRSGA